MAEAILSKCENSTKLPEFIGAKIQYNNKEFVYIHSVECLGDC